MILIIILILIIGSIAFGLACMLFGYFMAQ